MEIYEKPCMCTGPGMCPRFNINQTEYAWRVCSEQCTEKYPCSPEKSLAYRKKWAGEKKPKVKGKPRKQRIVKKPTWGGGVGTELKDLLKSIGIEEKSGCGCSDMAAKMDKWGVEGCRTHRNDILKWLRGKQKEVTWVEKITIAKNVILNGLFFNPMDPAPGLLDEAIKRFKERKKE
jgi:hypothetical protein